MLSTNFFILGCVCTSALYKINLIEISFFKNNNSCSFKKKQILFILCVKQQNSGFSNTTYFF